MRYNSESVLAEKQKITEGGRSNMSTQFKKKKKSKLDDSKVLKAFIFALAAILVATLAIAFVVTTSNDNIGKVDGQKIYDYEFDYYLYAAIAQADADIVYPEDVTTTEKEELRSAFWTKVDENGKTPVDLALETALENARVYKASYVIAKEAGYGLSSAQKTTVKTNVDSSIQQYYQYYTQLSSYYGGSYSYEDCVKMVCGRLSIKEFKELSIKQSAVEYYKSEVLKTSYSISEEELRAAYDAAPNDYRTITVRLLKLAKPTTPTVPTKDDGSAINKTDADYATYQTVYEKYEADLVTYQTQLSATTTRVNNIISQINEDGTYSEIKLDETTGQPVVDETTGQPKYSYTDVDFTSLVSSDSSESDVTTTKGIHEINKDAENDVEAINTFAYSAQYNAERNQFTAILNNVTIPYTTEGDVGMTKLALIEDGTSYYIVRVEGIEDYDNSVESAEGKADSIKDTIKAAKEEEKAVADMKVMASDDKYKLSKKNDEIIKNILNEMIEEYQLQ